MQRLHCMVLFSLLVFTVTFNNRADAEVLTLKQAIRFVLEQSPDVRAAEHRLEAAKSLVTQAETGFYPKINLGEQYTKQH